MSTPPSLFDFDDMGVCIKDASSCVIFQNEVSRRVCGDRMSSSCHLCGDDAVVALGDHTCEFSRFPESCGKKLSVFYITDRQIQVFRDLFRKACFTKQEIEIGLMVLQRKINPEICARLFISSSTLKTHLNHMYRKCPELKALRLGT